MIYHPHLLFYYSETFNLSSLPGGIFSEQVFVVSDEVSHSLRPLIHQMVESGGGALTAVGMAPRSATIVHTIYPLLSKEPVDGDTIVTVCWLVSIL